MFIGASRRPWGAKNTQMDRIFKPNIMWWGHLATNRHSWTLVHHTTINLRLFNDKNVSKFGFMTKLLGQLNRPKARRTNKKPINFELFHPPVIGLEQVCSFLYLLVLVFNSSKRQNQQKPAKVHKGSPTMNHESPILTELWKITTIH